MEAQNWCSLGPVKEVQEISLTKEWSGDHLKDKEGSAGDASKLGSLGKYEAGVIGEV